MQLEAFFAPLMKAPLFEGLSPVQMKSLALGCERVTIGAGTPLIAAGEVGETAYLIVAGVVVRIEHPLGSVGREEFGPGTLIGEMAMLVETEHSSTVVALSSVTAIKLSRTVLAELFDRDPSMAEYFADRLRERLDDMLGGLRKLAGLLRLEDAMAAEAGTAALH